MTTNSSEYWNPKNETLVTRRAARAAAPQAEASLRLGVREERVPPPALGCRALSSRPAPLARRPAADPLHDASRLDGRAGGSTAVRSAACRAADKRDPLSHDLRNDRAYAAARAGRDEGLGVDLRDVGVRPVGLRPAPGRHRAVRVLVRHVHRLLGRALRMREDRVSRAVDRRRDDRVAGEEHHRHGRDDRVLDADLRVADVAGGGRDGRRPRPRQQGRAR